jgi:hypothetical protein
MSAIGCRPRPPLRPQALISHSGKEPAAIRKTDEEAGPATFASYCRELSGQPPETQQAHHQHTQECVTVQGADFGGGLTLPLRGENLHVAQKYDPEATGHRTVESDGRLVHRDTP